MPPQSEATVLWQLTEVPAGWPLATVIDAFLSLAAFDPSYFHVTRACEAVSRRLVDLWASQPAEAQAWRELHAREATRPEALQEALRRHGAAERGKYGWRWWRFSEAGLLRGEPRGSVAEQERRAAEYLQWPLIRDRCRELAEKLAQAESQENARKRQKLEEETSERHRLEAELRKSQEEGRDLRNRLAAAEAEVCSKTAELQTAQGESATCKEHCEELATRAAAAESAVVELRQELGQLQEEHGTCQQRCEELVARLEAEAAEHANSKERLSRAEADAAERRMEVERLQEESRGYQERCQQAEAAARLALAESKMELELKNARLQERCEQLQQHLAKAEGQIQVLWEEKATYKERCRQLEREAASPRTPSIQASHTQQGPAPSDDAACRGQASNLTEELGYVLVDDAAASSSALSCSSWFSVGPDCFMPDAIFKTRSGGIEHFLRGRDLQKGSRVVAEDGETMVEVCEVPVLSQAQGFVRLQAEGAMLEVTAEHPVQVPAADDGMDDGEGGGSKPYVEAGKLKKGDLVMLDAGEPAPLTNVVSESGDCEVLKLAFKPNLSVAVFSSPPCILSKGANSKPDPRRGKKCRSRGQRARVEESADDGRASMPNTAGTSTEILLRAAAGAS